MSTYSNRLQPALQNLLQRVFFLSSGVDGVGIFLANVLNDC